MLCLNAQPEIRTPVKESTAGDEQVKMKEKVTVKVVTPVYAMQV
jgi:hypothetical protein